MCGAVSCAAAASGISVLPTYREHAGLRVSVIVPGKALTSAPTSIPAPCPSSGLTTTCDAGSPGSGNTTQLPLHVLGSVTLSSLINYFSGLARIIVLLERQTNSFECVVAVACLYLLLCARQIGLLVFSRRHCVLPLSFTVSLKWLSHW